MAWYVRYSSLPPLQNNNSELEQRRRRRRGPRLVKMNWSLGIYILQAKFAIVRICSVRQWLKTVLKLNIQRRRSIPNGNTKNQPSPSMFRRQRKLHLFTLLFCSGRQRNAQPLFCSLDLLFGDVLVAVAIVVCLSSLIFGLTMFRVYLEFNADVNNLV